MAKMQNRQRLLDKMAKMPAAVRSAIKQALAQGADEIVAEQKRLAPVSSGDLRNSIGSTFGAYIADNANVRGVTSTTKGADPDLTVTIHAGDERAYYAAFVEFGTAPHLNGGLYFGTKNPGAKATPFFYPAFRANRRRVKARISRATTKAVKAFAAS